MASFDVNAAVSEAWTAPTAMAASMAKAGSDSLPRSKMAASDTAGNFRPSIPVPTSEDMASFAAQMLPDDITRNLLFLSMFSGNLPFGNGIAGNIHPLFPGLFPIGLPQQQFSSLLPQNHNISPLPHIVPDTGIGKARRRTVNRSRSERRSVPSNISRSFSIDSFIPPNYVSGISPSSTNTDTVQTYLPGANNVSTSKTPSIRSVFNSPLAQNTAVTTHVRSRDHERSMHRNIPILSATAATSRPAGMAIPRYDQTNTKCDSKQLPIHSTTLRGEANCPRSTGMIKGKYTARSYKIPNVPSFNEAEAAATLLGMRNGQNTGDRNALLVQNSTNASTSRWLNSKTDSSNYVQTAILTTGESQRMSHQGHYGVVDLSIKPKQMKVSQNGAMVPNGQNLVCVTTKQTNRVATSHCKPMPNVNTVNNDQSRTNDVAHHTPGVIKRSDSIGEPRVDTTSLVSQYRNCVCAFDPPTSTVKLPPVIDKAQLANSSAQQQAFNYKKVICEKFSQCVTPDNHTYANSSRDQVATRKSPCDHPVANDPAQVPTVRDKREKSVNNNTSGQGKLTQYAKYTSRNQNQPAVQEIYEKASFVDKCATNVKHSIAESSIRHANDKCGSTVNVTTTSKSAPVSHDIDSHKVVAASTVAGINKLKNRHDVPSFRDLRQQSKDSHVHVTANEKDEERSFKSSNLYRIRNSAFGGSNDSLHSDSSVKEDIKAEIDSASNSSSSDSDRSSDDSDIEDEGTKSDHPEADKSSIAVTSPTKSPSRLRFVLSKPKFTLTNHETIDDNNNNETAISSVEGNGENKRGMTTTVVSAPASVASRNKTKHEKSNVVGIPELKSDENENENTFKYKFIKALANPGSKEGLAVDGKHLRALLGDGATCFYHNNKKYVLKRWVKSSKDSPNDDHDRSSPNEGSHKSIKQDESSYSPEPEIQRKIEPRISVTAVKRSSDACKPQLKLSSKKLRKAKKRSIDSTKKSVKPDVGKGRRFKRLAMDDTKITMPHNKRRRRNHEIENLVYEGAGGKTPIPDLSLRDSDVFSNIKLRRRKAAKRGIVPTNTPEEKQLKSTTVFCRKRIKSAAQKRAIANRNRKKSIESKLRKYGKKDRIYPVRNDEPQPKSGSPRASCVRINAGFSNPQVNETNGDDTHGQEVGVTAICDSMQGSVSAVKQESNIKCPALLTDAILNKKTADLDSGLARDDDSGESATLTKSSKVSKEISAGNADVVRASKISQRNSITELSETDNSHYRRTSKRISDRKQSNDHRSNEKKMDDDEISISSTNFETDSTRSDSPLLTRYRNANNHKTKRNYSQHAKLQKSATKSKNQRNENKRCKFSLMSCFSTEAALTLEAGFGDLKPSYSMKTTGKTGVSSVTGKWNIGASAVGIKQQLQRDIWRNMTLDMFTNS